MKDRIRLIMESEHLTPSAFADKLQLGRAVVSHILNGRNNPSLDVVTRILSKMTYIDSDWLLTGEGNMYKFEETALGTSPNSPSNHNTLPNQPDLFSQNIVSPSIDKVVPEYRKENIAESPVNDDRYIDNKHIIYQKATERKVSKIIIYYTDNTFETFNADNKPL